MTPARTGLFEFKEDYRAQKTPPPPAQANQWGRRHLASSTRSYCFWTTTSSVELSTELRFTFVGSIASVICQSEWFAESARLSVTLNCPVSPSADGELNRLQ